MSDTIESGSSDLIRAAGGLVWRVSPAGRTLAIVHRSQRYGEEWTLPKGKVQPEESWLDTAMREVYEETGCKVKIGNFAGSIGYQVKGQPKVVCFWHMTVVGEPESSPPDPEVDQVAWLPIKEASERLRYPLEKSLVEVLLEIQAPNHLALEE